MNQSPPVEVFAARDTLEAYFVCNLLRESGIEALVVGDLLRGIVGELPPIQTTPRVWVAPGDAERARVVVDDYERHQRALANADQTPVESVAGAQPYCYFCGQSVAPNQSPCPACGNVLEWDGEGRTRDVNGESPKSPAEEPYVTYETIDHVAILTLNRPEKRNPLSIGMMSELDENLKQIARDRSIRVVIIRAAGPAFSSGHDLREMVGASAEQHRKLFRVCSDLMQAIQQHPKPVIAEVHGIATAGGCQLAASCDLIVASDNASFATPGVRIGLFCTTPAVPLVRVIPTKKAMEMLLTGAAISAREAERLGLVNRVVSAEQLHDETLSLAQQIGSASPDTIGIGKRAVYQHMQLDLSAAYRLAQSVMVQNVQSPDAQEGIRAFLEKRAPIWQDDSPLRSR